ncbi:MAG: methylated-DNA--[protein]-cysteine S-methyltransferase [Oscillibacter sp.]|jgi:methylated-DNA-[protein]-cysteine S-methyltransferase|nr:methylated-DNA--[protein]-cysteine S-methyltransferase [Oscillibacter sp.]
MVCTALYASPIGILTLAGEEDSLIGLWIEGQKYFRRTLQGRPCAPGELPVLTAARRWLDRYFAGQAPSPAALSLAPGGSEFQRAVWKALCEIPYGTVITYGALAKKAAAQYGRESLSPRAVGGAVGRNPISVIIPCHRVVGSDGSLTGYAGGLEKKLQLLKLEGAALAGLSAAGKERRI